MPKIILLVMAIAIASLCVVSCDADDTRQTTAIPTAIEYPRQDNPTPPTQPTFTLQLLHASDMDGSTGALDNVETFSAMLDAFRSEYPDNTLVLSSGDNYIPGPRFFAAGDSANDPVLGVSGDGRGDIALLNAMGFQASVLGNHEMDRGTGVFASIVASETGDAGSYPGATFPYLSSNLVFTDNEDRLRPGDEAEGTYPLRFDSPSEEPVLLVNTDADYRYLGKLVVGFDDRGVVIPGSIDPSTSGAYATDDQGARESGGQPIAEVSRVADSLRSVLRERGSNVLGSTNVYLSGRRIDVRTQETNLGNLAADADLWLARQVDPDVAVSFKNGGGIRDDIGIVVQPPGTTDPAWSLSPNPAPSRTP